MRAFRPKQSQAPQQTTSSPSHPHARERSVNHGEKQIAKLQSTLGNQATLHWLQAQSNAGEAVTRTPLASVARSVIVGPKLAIHPSGNALEQEADRVSEQVLSQPDQCTAPGRVSEAPTGVQRECSCGGTCAACQGHDEEEHLQMKAVPSSGLGQAAVAPPIVHQVLDSPGQPLDAATRAFMEPRFGHDLSSVRVHTDSQAAGSAKQIHAQAYTVGQDVVFADNKFSPTTPEGRRLLAHELVHTIQQSGNHRGSEAKHPSTMEREAEHGASQVVTGKNAPAVTNFPIQVAMSPEAGCELCRTGRSSSSKSTPDVLRFTATKEEVTATTLTTWAVRQLREGKNVQRLVDMLSGSHEFEGSQAAREAAVEGLAFLLQRPALRQAAAAGSELNRARAEAWRQARENARKEYIERGQRLAPQGATLIMPEDFGDYHPIAGSRSNIYPEIWAGNVSGDIEIIGLDGGLVIFSLLGTFYYAMGVDAFHRVIGAGGLVASGVWQGSKGVLYAGAWAAQKAGQIGRLLPLHPVANVAFRGLEKAGSEGLEELDRMEAVRLGYQPHEKTELEKMEEGVDYLDPTGLQPEFKIPGGHETAPLSEHESTAHVAGSEAVHLEGGSGKPALEVRHGEAGGEPAKAGRDTVKENVVHEAARQGGSEVMLEDGTHGIAAYGEGKNAGFEFCSNGCSLVTRKLKQILDGLPENYDPKMTKDLRFLYLKITGVEKELASGRIKKTEANRFAREIAKELNTYVKQDAYLDKLLQQSPKELEANRAQVKQGLGTGQAKPGKSGRRLERNYRIEGDREAIKNSRRGYQVYEYGNKEGELLYVGKSGGAKTQQDWLDRFWKDHVRTEWIGEAETVTVRSGLTEQEAFALEEALIPIAKYNKQRGTHSSQFQEASTSENARSAQKRRPSRFKIKVLF
jgi:hypothetical protein